MVLKIEHENVHPTKNQTEKVSFFSARRLCFGFCVEICVHLWYILHYDTSPCVEFSPARVMITYKHEGYHKNSKITETLLAFFYVDLLRRFTKRRPSEGNSFLIVYVFEKKNKKKWKMFHLQQQTKGKIWIDFLI